MTRTIEDLLLAERAFNAALNALRDELGRPSHIEYPTLVKP